MKKYFGLNYYQILGLISLAAILLAMWYSVVRPEGGLADMINQI